MKYQRRENASYLLYSVGWNGMDDGGKVALLGSKQPVLMTMEEAYAMNAIFPAPRHTGGSNPLSRSVLNFQQGDWVWPVLGR